MKDLERLDVVVVGAGVVGLAIGRALQFSGREVVTLEAEPRVGMHTSSRNSEVIHAGIYYEPGTLKARLCVQGKSALYAYCEQQGVPFSRLGKMIVATDGAQIPGLEALKAQAEQNGVQDLEWLDSREVQQLEPAVRSVRGLWSPSSGIVDSHALMDSLRRDAVSRGAHVVVSTPVDKVEVVEDGFVVTTAGPDSFQVHCRALINSAGLSAQNVARTIRGLASSSVCEQHFAKGHYFSLSGKSPFKHLVYPLPVSGGLGIHVTLDLAGETRFGPDVKWISGIDYSFDEHRAASFASAIRRYYPELDESRLVPGYTGIRPKLAPAGSTASDFVIQTSTQHKIPNLVNLYGIESPGLTASLAIADVVAEALG